MDDPDDLSRQAGDFTFPETNKPASIHTNYRNNDITRKFLNVETKNISYFGDQVNSESKPSKSNLETGKRNRNQYLLT